MSNIQQLVFLHQIAAPCHLAILAESIGLKTHIIDHPSKLEQNNVENSFYLIAQQGAALDNKGIPLVASRLLSHVPVALYQVDKDTIDAESALMLGIRGLLYTDQGMDLMLSGLSKMIEDELWFDRLLMSNVIRQLVNKLDAQNDSYIGSDTLAMLQTLTKRERTIIQFVSSGARNKEIAHRLCISEHTVKAHISSIFRKTQSRNRVELLRWAQTYQSHFDLCS
ncbi:helix-turn-helix transcriptional regulator [Shewanella marina]|uniref:helix-turn-helix transcriptional regulator n=1 Tax=Shewanella marina TaxID=487319 RepID=UPI000472456B|nr:response regulator transcription factor [Shewanella marina]